MVKKKNRPACSSKQVLSAFEDVHLLRAKAGLEVKSCMPPDAHKHAPAFAQSGARAATFDRSGPRPAAGRHERAIKKVAGREQIVLTLEVKATSALFSRDI